MIAYVRIFGRNDSHRQSIKMMSNDVTVGVPSRLAHFKPRHGTGRRTDRREVGYIATGLKTVRDCRVGDTITLRENPHRNRFMGISPSSRWFMPGFIRARARITSFAERSAGEGWELNDASLGLRAGTSNALNFGFRCGFPRPVPLWKLSRSVWNGIRLTFVAHGAQRRI